MEIKVDLFESPRVTASITPKPHPRVTPQGVVSNKLLYEAVQKYCSSSPLVIESVLYGLNKAISELLKNGHSVHVEGLGFFNLKISCSDKIDIEHVSSSDFFLKQVNFSADKYMMEALSDVKFKFVKDNSRHSSKLTDAEICTRLIEYFEKKEFVSRKEIQNIMGWSQSTACRTVGRLLSEQKLRNIGSRHQPLYTKGDNL